MQTAERFDVSTLAWIKGEIDETLKQARVHLEDAANGNDPSAKLKAFVEAMHQVRGTLQIVELEAAAAFAQEMESLAAALVEGLPESEESAYEVLMRALLQLPDYLESLQSGRVDSLLPLLSTVNELRRLRGEKALGELSLFHPDLDVATPGEERPGGNLVAAAVKALPYYQTSLAKLFRGSDVAPALNALRKVCEAVSRQASRREVRQVFWVNSALVEALQHDGLTLGRDIKQLLGKVEQLLRYLVHSGEDAVNADNVRAVTRILLYHIGHASDGGPLVAGVKEAFGLDRLLPGGEDELGGFNAELKRTVAADLMEELSHVKDTLDVFVRGQRDDLEALAPIADGMRRLAETLDLLRQESLHAAVSRQLELMQQIRTGELAPDDDALMGIAAALLSVEAALSDWGMNTPIERGDDQEADDGERTPEAEAEHARVVRQVMKEAKSDLIRVREAINDYLEAGGDRQRLHELPELFHRIVGSMGLLSYGRVAAVMRAAARYARDRLASSEGLPTDVELDHLADAVMSIEYYLEAFVEGRVHPGAVLEVAENAVSALGYPVGAPDENAQPQDGDVVQSLNGDTSGTVEAAEPPSVEPTAFAAPIVAEAPAGEPQLPASATSDGDDDLDDEIMQIFLEEAEEELEKIGRYLPKWESDPRDEDTRNDFRRCYHTLKGSGRLVGAESLGEFAWAIENMLNRVIDGSIAMTPVIFELLHRAESVIPQLIEQFRSGVPPQVDVGQLAEAAHALSRGESPDLDALPLPEASVSAPAARAVEPDALPKPAIEVDPELLEIYSKEANDHLETIGGFIRAAREGDSRRPSDDLLRALHTLKGSSRIAGVMEVAAVNEALEKCAKALLASHREFDDAGIAILESDVELVRGVLAHLHDPMVPMPALDPLVAEANALYFSLRHLEDRASPEIGLATLDETDDIPPAAVERQTAGDLSEAETDSPAPFDVVESQDDPTEDHIELSEEDWLLEASDAAAFELLNDAAAGADDSALDASGSPVDDDAVSADGTAAPEAPSETDEIVELVDSGALQTGVGAADLTDEASLPDLAPAEADGEDRPPLFELMEVGGEDGLAEAEPASETTDLGADESDWLLDSAESRDIDDSAANEPAADDDDAVELSDGFDVPDAWFSGSGQEDQAGEAALEAAPQDGLDAIETAEAGGDDVDGTVDDAKADAPDRHVELDSGPVTTASGQDFDEESAELVDLFLEEGSELLDQGEETLQAWLDNPSDLAPVAALQRYLHTIKGSARLAGVAAVGDLSHHLESMFEALGEGRLAFADSLGELVQQAHDRLGQMLDQVRRQQSVEAADDLIARIKAAVAGDAPTSADMSAPAAEPVESPAPAAGAEPVVDDYDPELIDLFLEEGGEILDASEETLQQWIEDPDDRQLVEALQRQLHTLKGSARMAGVTAVGDLSHSLETQFEAIVEGRLQRSEEMFRLVQLAHDRLVEMLDRVRERRPLVDGDDLIRRIEALGRGNDATAVAEATQSDVGPDVVRSVEPVEVPPAAEATPEVQGEGETSLGQRAQVLVESFGADLKAWQQSPGDAERHARLSGVAEELERLARREDVRNLADIAAVTGILLREVHDGHVLVSDELFGLLLLVQERLLVLAEQYVRGLPLRSVQDLIDSLKELIARHGAGREKDDTEVDKPRHKPRIQHEMVRVRRDLMDNLVNFAGEVSIYRSRVEQQMNSFRNNLDELDDTVERLREQLRQFDIETEAQIASRYQEQSREYEDFDPLEFDRFTTMQQLSRSMMESLSDVRSLKDLLDDLARESETLLLQQGRVNTELQENLMQTRMVQLVENAPRLRRIVRQTGAELERQANLSFAGAEVEMDRRVVERLMAPLEHMLRNAVAHGIEPVDERRAAGKAEAGQINIAMSREGSEVVVRVSDDGRGIDVDAVRKKAIERGMMEADAKLDDSEIMQFILEPGFSTAQTLTQVAGRGVGMDVVSSEIRQLGGVLAIDSIRGAGTRFTIRLPLTLSVSRALLVNIGDEPFAIPLLSVQGIERIDEHELERLQQTEQPQYEWLGQDYELLNLRQILGVTAEPGVGDAGKHPLLLAQSGEHRVALLVDRIVGSREVVVKSLGPQLSTMPSLSGATILSDGSVALILELPALIRKGLAHRRAGGEQVDAAPAAERIPTVMIVDDSITVRAVTKRLLKRHNMNAIAAKDGVDALALLDETIPDVMLLDIEMPRMDGFELATHIRNSEQFRHIPIIMITSRTGDKHRQRAMDIGVNAYLGKPYSEGDLLDNIERLINGTD